MEYSDEEWDTIHAPINSAKCYELAIATLRKQWLENQQKDQGHEANSNLDRPDDAGDAGKSG